MPTPSRASSHDEGGGTPRTRRSSIAASWVRDLVWQGEGVTVKVDQLEAGHPLAWWLRPNARRANGGRWSVVVDERDAPEAPAEEGGWKSLMRLIDQIRLTLERWLPQAELGPGEVQWPGGGLEVAGATWKDSTLQLERLKFGAIEADATVSWSGPEPRATVQAAGLDDPWQVGGVVTPTEVEARFQWHQQPGEFAATFGERGWLPVKAEFTASAWRLPGETLRLGENYAEVSGNAAGTWEDGEGWVRLQANGVPRVGTEVPPLRVQLDAVGNLQQVTVRALEIFAPGIEAALEEPVTIDPRSQWAVNEATFRLKADLAELPGEGPAGRVEGHVRVEPVPESWPRLRGELQVRDVAMAEWSGIGGDVAAVLEWPRLTVETTQWRDDAGTELAAEGVVDFTTRQIERAEWTARLAPASVERWLPEGIAFGSVTAAGSLTGPWASPEHAGRVEATELVVQRSHPLHVAAEWTGQGIGAQVRAVVSTAAASATLVAEVNRLGADVSEFRLLQGEHELARLMQPASVRWSPRWQVAGLRLAGPVIELAAEVDDVAEGRLAVEAPRVSLLWLGDWWQDQPPVRVVHDLRVKGDLVRDVLVFTASGEIETTVANDERVVVGFALAGERDGLRVERVTASIGPESVITLHGRLPVTLHPRGPERVRVDAGGTLELAGQIAPSEEFWSAVETATGVHVDAPRMALDLTGRWSQPRGSARIAAGRIAFTGERWRGVWPEITALQATFQGTGQALELEEFQALVEGQQVRARGRLPLTPDEWAQLRAAPLDYLRLHGAAEIEVPDADLAALARLVPAYLAPAGRLQSRLQFGPDGRIEGELRLQGALSRPLGPLGVLQDVQADLVFSGREMQVRRVEARMGGQPVRLSGTAALSEQGPPRLNLTLQGQNLPLVRDTGLLLRADLDLTLTTNDRGDGRAAGTVRLRDSLFLAELQDFVPRGGGGGGNRAASRPPYFSVAVEPLNRWRLDVLVVGREFLRLRTPVLEGTASARFQLSGTLGEPRAIGEATVEQGRVKLPFATFIIQEGDVRLTQADPFQPQINLTGTSRRLGYDLRMELTGTAADPRLQFFSSPPLPSEDIVLLVMAGQAPQEEVTYTGGQRAVQIGTFLGRGLIGDLFGGDGGDRLSVTSGERISRQGRETYRFMYELSPRLSLVGEYDEFDSYNAGVRWRLLPRRDRDDREEDNADAANAE
jgi:translocation and assembly module TamB